MARLGSQNNALRTDDLLIVQGATWGVIIPVVQAGSEEPADLTGWSARAQVRKSKTATDVLHSWTIGAGNITVGESTVTLTVTAAESAAFEWSSGVYDVELFNGETVYRLTQGRIRVDAEVTR